LQGSPERDKTPQSLQLDESTESFSTASTVKTQIASAPTNVSTPKSVAKLSANHTELAEAEERSLLSTVGRTLLEAAATTSLASTHGLTTAVPTADESAFITDSATTRSAITAANKAAVGATSASTMMSNESEPAKTKDNTSSQTTTTADSTAKEEVVPLSTTGARPILPAKEAIAQKKVMAEGASEEGTSPRSRPLKRPIPTPRYVQRHVV